LGLESLCSKELGMKQVSAMVRILPNDIVGIIF
jgi:hypothetical protein